MPQAPTWEETVAVPSWEDTVDESQPTAPKETEQEFVQRMGKPIVPTKAQLNEPRSPNDLFEPFKKIPRVNSNDPRFRAAVSGAIGQPASEDALSSVAAILNSAAGFAEGIESPAGVATAAAGPLGKVAQKLAALGWGAYSAAQVPEAARTAGELSVTGTPQEKKEAYLGLAGSIAIPAAIGAGVVVGESPARGLAKEISQAIPKFEDTFPIPVREQGVPAAPPQGMVGLKDLTPQSEAAAAAAPPEMVGEPTTKLSPQAEAAVKEVIQKTAPILPRASKEAAVSVEEQARLQKELAEELGQEPTKKEGEAHSSDLAKAQEPPPESAVVPKTEAVTPKAPFTEKVGDDVRIMSVDSVLAKTHTDENGVRYDLFNAAKLKDNRASVRISDPESGRVVSIKQYPTYDAAEADFNKATKPPPPTPAPVKAEPSGADVYQSMRGEMHRVWVKLPDKSAVDVGSIEEHPELSDKAKAIEQANKVWASREQKPIPPRSLPAYGISSKDVAKQYGMPEDFYGTADEQGMVSSKYRTKEYDAAVEAEQRASKIQGINGPTIRRQARERTDAEFRKIVESARKAEPSAPPPPTQPRRFAESISGDVSQETLQSQHASGQDYASKNLAGKRWLDNDFQRMQQTWAEKRNRLLKMRSKGGYYQTVNDAKEAAFWSGALEKLEDIKREQEANPLPPPAQPKGETGEIAPVESVTPHEKQIADVGIPKRVPPIITTPEETKAWLAGIKAAYPEPSDAARRAINSLKAFAKSGNYYDASSRFLGNLVRALGVDISHKGGDTSLASLGANKIRIANQASLFHELGHVLLLQKSGGVPWPKVAKSIGGELRGEWKALQDADWALVARDKWDYWTQQTERYASLLNLYVTKNARFKALAPELYAKVEKLLDESASTVTLFQEARKRGESPYNVLNDKLSKLQAPPTPPPVEQKGVGPATGEGPGATVAGPTGIDPKAQIEQLADSFRNIEGQKLTIGEKLKQAFQVGERLSGAKDALSKALEGLKSTGNYLIGKWNQVQNIDDLLRAKGDLSAALETRGWRVRQWEKLARKATPSLRDQAAIAKYVDAGGDMAELQRGFTEAPPKYKQAYQDAMNLKGDLKISAENIRNYFDSRLQEAIDAGVLEHGVEDYIHRIYESKPKVAKQLYAYVQTGLLQKNPALTKKRIFQFDWEAEKLGYKPVQSYIPRIAQYESSLARAIAAREFIKKATTMRAADGRPVIDIKGVGIPIEDPAGVREATLIKPQFNPANKNQPGTPNYRGDYVNKEFPALSRWKWVAQDSNGKPIFVQGDVAIHPDYVNRVAALLEPSRVRYGRYGAVARPALAVGSAVKQTMLDLSGFHQVQTTVHGLEHRINPLNLVQEIDFNNPDVDGLLKGGVTLGGDYRMQSEGLAGQALTRHIPFLGPALESYHQWLFQDYIPRLKMTMALHALERNKARYSGVKSPEEIYHQTASEANAAFGEQNYIMLERSKTAQDMARLILLAPDFLEARGRFAGQALTKGGKAFGNEQRTALLLGALTMYVTARILNKATTGQYHNEPENLFSVVHNGKAYGLRTVQGDILHLIEHPLQFWMHRLNPVFGRTTLEMATGRDEFGRKRSMPEQLWDFASTVMPISLRTSRERSIWESLANSFGINARRWQDTDDAFKLAKDWKAKHGIGERGEFIYDRDKDPLRPLKLALTSQDEGAAVKEIKKLIQSKTYTIPKLNDYFRRYASMPFTGSRANDVAWKRTLSEDQLKTVDAAKQHKESIRQLYMKALAKVYAE